MYDALCRSPLGARPLILASLVFVLGTALAWGLTRLLSPRAAYLHVGAAIGTIMAANVLMVIIPSQKEMVAAMAQGRPPDAELGKQAALRSLHNNYLTLPVLFIMVSSHYPATYGHPLNWAILAGLAVIGVGTRHWFNLRNQGRRNAWLLPAAALGLVALALVTRPRSDTGGAGASFADVRVIVADPSVPHVAARPAVATGDRRATHSQVAARPMIRIPFCVTSRVDRWRNWCGNQESAAMFDNTDGPPRKPVLAATKSSPASVTNTRSNAA